MSRREKVSPSALTTPRMLEGMIAHAFAPQLASSHAMIWSSRLPKPSGGTAILTRTGNRRSASRTACCAAFIEQSGRSRSGVLRVGLFPSDHDR
jgi:hypothetical protein